MFIFENVHFMVFKQLSYQYGLLPTLTVCQRMLMSDKQITCSISNV